MGSNKRTAHGDVVEYTLTEEERQKVIEKYGPPIAPLKTRKDVTWSWTRLTLSKYKYLQREKGWSDIQIRRRFDLDEIQLRDLKIEWGVAKVRKHG